MKAYTHSIDGIVEIVPKRHSDKRGYFVEVFRGSWFRKNIEDVGFVQENQSLSKKAGTIRGLHFQSPPAAQGKLVRCLTGAVFDVAVDIRHGSPTFGQWTAATLTAENGHQLWVPAGCAHGFCTMMGNTTICYKVTAYYDPERDLGIAWNDDTIGIDWPTIADFAELSVKDTKQPMLHDLPAYFTI